MKIKFKHLLFLIVALFTIPVNATNIIDNPELLYTAPLDKNGPLTQKISLKRRLTNIDDLINTLNSISGFNTSLKSRSANKISPFIVNLNNVTIAELLNDCTKKLGYIWQYKNSTINFYAITPLRTHAQILKQDMWSLNPSDKTLRNALNNWCKKVGWQLVWNVDADYPITTKWDIYGSFENAVNEVLSASQTTNVPLEAIMHDGNHVLEIYDEHSDN